jgi:hypothetical protein
VGVGYDMTGPHRILATPVIFPLEIGYGITNNLLIHFDYTSSIGLVSEELAGGGISYYINDFLYTKAVFGRSYSGLDYSSNNKGLGYSLGLGFISSQRSSFEATYIHLDFDTAVSNDKPSNNVHEPYNIIGISFMYRLF